jgi:hypothetical protein
MQSAQGDQSGGGRDVHVAEALIGTAEGSYEQKAAVVEGDEEMRMNEGR